MRKYAFVVIALLVVGTFVGARAVGAQNDPFQACLDPTFDLNGDGIVSGADARAWAALASQCLDQESGQGFISTEACSALIGSSAFARVDLDGDGDLDHDDGIALGNRTYLCTQTTRTRIPR